MEDHLDLSEIETEEQLLAALKEFRKKNGITYREPNFKDFLWCEENVEKYKADVCSGKRNATFSKSFYISKSGEGSVHQHEALIDAVTWLKKTHQLGEAELDRVLNYEKPLLRFEMMTETSPGSFEFRKRLFDLVETSLELKSRAVLERILPYIDFSKYDRDAIHAVLQEEA